MRRKDLLVANDMMSQPAALHSWPVQSDAPRVQCCFAAAEALGLLRVSRALHRAEATAEITAFNRLEPARRWWSLIEAMWQRVRWATLRPSAFGDTDAHQTGRRWLGAELARRRRPLELDWRLTPSAEVLESFLLPCWRDGGLLRLTYDPSMPVNGYYEKRSTRLRRVTTTDLGRWAFARLSELAPESTLLEHGSDEAPARPKGLDFFSCLEEAGRAWRFRDYDWEEEDDLPETDDDPDELRSEDGQGADDGADEEEREAGSPPGEMRVRRIDPKELEQAGEPLPCADWSPSCPHGREDCCPFEELWAVAEGFSPATVDEEEAVVAATRSLLKIPEDAPVGMAALPRGFVCFAARCRECGTWDVDFDF